MAHERMAAFRAAKGWSQAELAERIGCSQGFVAQVEAGHKRLGLGTALALERVSADWELGPITGSEWLRSDTDNVDPEPTVREAS